MDVCTAKQGQHRIAHAYPRPFYSLYLKLWCPHPPLFYSCLGSTSISRAPPRPKSYTEGSRNQSTLAWREGRDAHLTARDGVHFPVFPSIFQHSGMMRSVCTWALRSFMFVQCAVEACTVHEGNLGQADRHYGMHIPLSEFASPAASCDDPGSG